MDKSAAMDVFSLEEDGGNDLFITQESKESVVNDGKVEDFSDFLEWILRKVLTVV